MLIVLRHGQTEANAGGLLLGRSDPPLTGLGRSQAARAADALRPLRISRVVTSPLARARETAAALGLATQVDERWIELDYGEFEGRAVADIPDDTWRRWRSDVDFAPPGGESLAAVGGRVRAACDDLAAEARERDVVVVTHVSPVKAAVAWALGVDDRVSWRTFVAVASITRIGFGAAGASLHSFNETWHLTPGESDGRPA